MNKPLPPGRHVVLGPLEPLDEVVTVDERGEIVEIKSVGEIERALNRVQESGEVDAVNGEASIGKSSTTR